ncbi:hypothetical protein [Deinococcus multiflagellatus]|uniref:Contractile injection system tube protein N-terminal domain-containing protein n=1 Tax=Deinococcus multiflagellatus TaxID=1656887 RepID=A0ABW1ZT50_9DEIO|nr:hypothetical protein [Deinococcus multiflagellatus]MBZ9713608.1 hypothetical protein [Deinococcus multiflagellatus]
MTANGSGGQFARARIVPVEGDGKSRKYDKPIPCMFNPREYSISRTLEWKTASNDNTDTGNKVYAGGSPAKLTLELFFDTYAFRSQPGVVEDVRKHTDRLWAMTQMDPSTTETAKGSGLKKLRPPKVLFQWGSTWHFEAVIKDMEQQFTLFMPDGTPVRSIIKVTFEQADRSTAFYGPNAQGPKATHVSQGIRNAAADRGFSGDLRRTTFGKG